MKGGGGGGECGLTIHTGLNRETERNHVVITASSYRTMLQRPQSLMLSRSWTESKEL